MSIGLVIRNTLYYGIVPKLTVLLSIIMLPLTTPFLTTFDYGIYGVLISYAVLFMSIAPLGMNVHLTNSFFEYPHRYNIVWGRVLMLILISSFLFGLLNMGILMMTLPLPSFTGKLGLCVLGSMPIFLVANGFLAQHIFPLTESPKPLVFTNLAGPVAGMAVSFILIFYFKAGYWGLIASSTVSSIIIFLVFVKYVWKDFNIWPIWDSNRKRLKNMLRIALPLVPHTLGFVLLTSSARIVMSQYGVSYDEIGLFSHGSTMGDYATVITSALVTALMPQIQRSYRSKNYKEYRNLYFLCQTVAVITSFVLCIWMPEIYSILIRNARLAQSCDIACMLCFANVVFSFYTFMSTPAFINKDTPQLLWLVFVPGILNFAACYILIPFWGYRVAVYSTIFFYWSQLLVPFVVGYYKKSVQEWMGDRRIVGFILLVVLVDLVIANEAIHAAVWIKVVMTLLAVMALYVGVKKRMNKERKIHDKVLL